MLASYLLPPNALRLTSIIQKPMKIHLLALVFIFSCLATRAQVFYSDGNTDEGQSLQQTDSARKRIVANGIRLVHIYRSKADSGQSGKKDSYLSVIYKYDDRGDLIDYQILNKHGNTIQEYLYRYDNDGRNVEYTVLKRSGKIKRQMTYDYDKAGNNTETHWFFDNDPPARRVRIYDDKNHLIEQTYYYDHYKKQGSRYTYSYYDDGSRKQSIEYNRKGKILHTWNYDCSPVGQLAGSKFKDTSKICVRYETDKNGNRIKVTEEFVKRGNVVRRVNKYDLKDRLLDVSDYNKKGMVVYRYSYNYNNDGRIIEALFYKTGSGDKVKTRYTYDYDPKGKLLQQLVYKHSRPEYVYKYDYLVSK